MLDERLKNKLAAIPTEEPDEQDLSLLQNARVDNDNGEFVLADDYFARRKGASVSLRIPKSLRDKLQANAEMEGVSLNQYCMYLLTAGVSGGTDDAHV